MDIRYVDYGIANRFKDYIEVNKHLKKYPKLHDKILQHEFAHTDKKFSKEDFKLDFLMESAINYKDLIKFMFKHPRSFIQMLPCYYTSRQGLVYDINIIIMYIVMTIVIGGSLWIGLKII